MPTNLPPEYFRVDEQYRAATSPSAKIKLLEELISTIPKHKGTDKLRADLRRKLSRLKSDSRGKKGVGRHESAYSIDREGSGQVVVIGPANSGKSSLVAALTNADPEVAPFPFPLRSTGAQYLSQEAGFTATFRRGPRAYSRYRTPLGGPPRHHTRNLRKRHRS